MSRFFSLFLIYCTVFTAITVVVIWAEVKTKRPDYVIAMDEVSTVNKKPHLASVNMTLVKTSQSKTLVSVKIEAREDVYDLKVRISFLQYKDGRYRPAIFTNKIEDLCAYWKKPNYFYMAHFIYPAVQKLGHLPDSCPVKKGCYHIDNATFVDIGLPPNVPEGKYKCQIDFSVNRKYLCTTNFFAKITKS